MTRHVLVLACIMLLMGGIRGQDPPIFTDPALSPAALPVEGVAPIVDPMMEPSPAPAPVAAPITDPNLLVSQEELTTTIMFLTSLYDSNPDIQAVCNKTNTLVIPPLTHFSKI